MRRWPPLAWVAHGKRFGDVIEVSHGLRVETHEDWFGEIVWDGPFQDARFDETDLVLGSGGRVGENGVTFVSAGHTMDRLILCRVGDQYWISNSLPAALLLSQTNVSQLYRSYPADFSKIILGIDQYDGRLKEVSNSTELIYHDNVVVDSGGIRRQAKPSLRRNLENFESYRDFLKDALVRCGENLRHVQRRFRYEWLGTLSSGFDSPTVCALARPAGLAEAMTITTARGGGDDSGETIGEQLGLNVHRVCREAWRDKPFSEVPFLASDAKGEDVYYASAGRLLDGRVVLTGYAAGAWAIRDRPLASLRRADQSGLSLTEYRLHAGFIHLPVPTLGLRTSHGIEMINRSEAMRPWVSGKRYDKPFCRRVLTELGVDSELYGQEKRAASILLFDRRSFLSPQSLADFQVHLRRLWQRDWCRMLWHRLKVICRAWSAKVLLIVAGSLPGEFARRLVRSVRLNEAAHRDFRYDDLFAWAIERTTALYRPDGEER
ncbi:MAG: hypothetical protein AAGA03_10815 [Planctomycetota bacterium]